MCECISHHQVPLRPTKYENLAITLRVSVFILSLLTIELCRQLPMEVASQI